MSSCDLCGKDDAPVVAKVEGVEMNVCKGCTKFGQVLRRPRTQRRPGHSSPKREDQEFRVVKDCATRILQARQKRSMTQEEFAHLLNEKSSIINKLESASIRPSLSLARKMEKALSIRLIEADSKEAVGILKKKHSTLTIGDMIKTK